MQTWFLSHDLFLDLQHIPIKKEHESGKIMDEILNMPKLKRTLEILGKS
jgi:hypothetical protein